MDNSTKWKDIGGSFLGDDIGSLLSSRKCDMLAELCDPKHKANRFDSFIPEGSKDIIKKNSTMNMWTGDSMSTVMGPTASYAGESSSFKEFNLDENPFNMRSSKTTYLVK